MRQLTKRQKSLLEKTLKLYETTYDDRANVIRETEIRTADDLPISVWNELERINDTEILWQEVNRFIQDWRFGKARQGW